MEEERPEFSSVVRSPVAASCLPSFLAPFLRLFSLFAKSNVSFLLPLSFPLPSTNVTVIREVARLVPPVGEAKAEESPKSPAVRSGGVERRKVAVTRAAMRKAGSPAFHGEGGRGGRERGRGTAQQCMPTFVREGGKSGRSEKGGGLEWLPQIG